jgi:hypothetical protein
MGNGDQMTFLMPLNTVAYPAALVDNDGDIIPDIHDIDSDNDGLQDVYEAGLSSLDSDSDGIPDDFDIDVTNGIDLNLNGLDDAVEALKLLENDLDGIANHFDLDSDNDGVTDTRESNGLDTDNDGVTDYRDLGSDGDGFTDLQESGGIDADGDVVLLC